MSINEPSLPKGWARTTLTSFGELICGQSPESNTVNDSGAGYVYVSGPEQWDGFRIHTCKWTTEPKRIVSEGCIFITVKGAGVGKIFPGIKCAIGRDIYAFKPRERMSSKFVELSLRHTVQDIIFHVKGDIPGLSKSHILNHSIILPGTAEQERIASKILELFSDLDKAEEALRKAQTLLKQYRQSVLKAAVTGELTRDWREQNKDRLETGEVLLRRILKARREAWEKAELKKMRAKGVKPKDDSWKKKYVEPKGPDTTGLPELPEGWVWANLDQLGFISGGITKNSGRVELPLRRPYLRVANVYENRLDLSEIKEIGVNRSEVEKATLRKNDVLIVEGNGSLEQIGRAAIWDDSIFGCVHQNHIIKLRPVLAEFSNHIIIWMMSRPGRIAIERVASSTSGLHTLSISKIQSIPVPIPSLEEIKLIIIRLEDAQGNYTEMVEEITWHIRRLSQLRQSILKSAFSGTLVPQDPNDEPASELLKRIAAEKAASASPPPARRGGPRKTRASTAPAQQTAAPASPSGKRKSPGLAHLRKSAGMSQAALAKAAGLNQASISQMETGKRAITAEQARELARVLGVTIESLQSQHHE